MNFEAVKNRIGGGQLRKAWPLTVPKQDKLGGGGVEIMPSSPGSVLGAEMLSSHYLGGAQRSRGEGKLTQKLLTKLCKYWGLGQGTDKAYGRVPWWLSSREK